MIMMLMLIIKHDNRDADARAQVEDVTASLRRWQTKNTGGKSFTWLIGEMARNCHI